jgi:hypothetical protein
VLTPSVLGVIGPSTMRYEPIGVPGRPASAPPNRRSAELRSTQPTDDGVASESSAVSNIASNDLMSRSR